MLTNLAHRRLRQDYKFEKFGLHSMELASENCNKELLEYLFLNHEAESTDHSTPSIQLGVPFISVTMMEVEAR